MFLLISSCSVVLHIPFFPPACSTVIMCLFGNGVPENCLSSLCKAYMLGLNKQLVGSFLPLGYVHFSVTELFMQGLTSLVKFSILQMGSGINSLMVRCKMSIF